MFKKVVDQIIYQMYSKASMMPKDSSNYYTKGYLEALDEFQAYLHIFIGVDDVDDLLSLEDQSFFCSAQGKIYRVYQHISEDKTSRSAKLTPIKNEAGLNDIIIREFEYNNMSSLFPGYVIADTSPVERHRI